MKYLIVGLGNVGDEYDRTRHNIGFEIVDELASQFEARFDVDRHAYVTEFKHKSRAFYLIKPTTYMNLSGKAMKYWMDKLKISIDNTLVVVDDLALPFGAIRMRKKGSDAGHNGLKDIQQRLETVQYSKLRFGIGNNFHPGQQVNYVLGKWTEEEMQKLPERIKKASEAILCFGTQGIGRAMNMYNNS